MPGEWNYDVHLELESTLPKNLAESCGWSRFPNKNSMLMALGRYRFFEGTQQICATVFLSISTIQIFSLMFNLILFTPAHTNLCSHTACTILYTLYLSLYHFDSLHMYNLWPLPKFYVHLGHRLCLLTTAPTAPRTILGIQPVHTSTCSLDLLTSWVRYSHFIHFGHLQDWCWLLWFTHYLSLHISHQDNQNKWIV